MFDRCWRASVPQLKTQLTRRRRLNMRSAPATACPTRPHVTRQRHRRAGATTLETALALSVFVTLMLGAVDLGYGVFRHHILAHAARQLTRQAIVHGALAERTGVWGPESISTKASQTGPIPDAIAASLVGWDLDEVEIQVEWMDAGNDARLGHRVRVAMTAPYRPIMTFIFGNPSITLTATSTMAVAH